MELLYVMYRICGGSYKQPTAMIISRSESAYGHYLHAGANPLLTKAVCGSIIANSLMLESVILYIYMGKVKLLRSHRFAVHCLITVLSKRH